MRWFFQMSTSEESDEMPVPDSESVFVIPGSVLLWRIAPRPPNSAQVRLGLLNAASLFIVSSDGAPSLARAGSPRQNVDEGRMSWKCSSAVPLLVSMCSVPSETLCIRAIYPFWCLVVFRWDFGGDSLTII